MLDPASFAWLLLPLGVVLGWVLAHRLRLGGPVPPVEPQSSTLSSEALAALDAAAASPGMAELQINLGVLFRQRGEVDQAIAVHHRLAELSGASDELRARAEFELAQDYLKGGLMDRAERLLDGLVAHAVHGVAALEVLLSIHERARDWEQAIEVARRLQASRAQDYGNLLAHYHCELADQAVKSDPDQARDLARKALDLYPDSVRASLLLGSLYEQAGDFAGALRYLRRVPDQDPRYLPEVIAPLHRCCQALQRLEMFDEFIREAEQRFPSAGCITLARVTLLKVHGENPVNYLAEHLARHPHWPGLLTWIDLQSSAGGAGAAPLAGLRDGLRERLKTRPRYRCTRCGLAPSMLFWQCPGCRHWDSVIPDEDRL